jgi:hypothetical protein
MPLGYEYLRGLGASALPGFPLAFAEGFPEFAGLEFEDLSLSGVSPDLVFDGGVLVGELLALEPELDGLDPEQFGLLPGDLLLVCGLPFDRVDFPGLCAKSKEGKDSRGDCECGQHCRGDSGDLAREVHRHNGIVLSQTEPAARCLQNRLRPVPFGTASLPNDLRCTLESITCDGWLAH